MFDIQVPFFIPLWRRVVTVGVTLGWAAFEVLTGAPAWGFLFAAVGIYCFHQFFIAWNPEEKND